MIDESRAAKAAHVERIKRRAVAYAAAFLVAWLDERPDWMGETWPTMGDFGRWANLEMRNPKAPFSMDAYPRIES